MKTRLDLSVVVPVYRSEATLSQLLARVDATLREHVPDSEIILVNDGSPDSSWEIIRQLLPSYERLKGINLMRNYGQHNALLAGIEESRGRFIVTMDDDLQTPPEEIPRLLAKLDEGFDLVYGVRERERHGIFRNSCSVGVKWILRKMLGVGVASSVTSYRAFRSELRGAFRNRTGPGVFVDALLCWGTTKVGTVVVSHRHREDGQSGYNLKRLIIHTINMVTSFSSVPLKIASLIGLGTTVVGLAMFLFVIAVYILMGKTVPGFTFLAGALTMFSGVQLFVLGIIGEYLARVHENLMGVPAFVIRERAGSMSQEENAGAGTDGKQEA